MANYDNQKNYAPSNKVAFNLDNVEKFFVDHGAFTLWEVAYLCPCRTKATNTPSQTCPRCHGVGFAYSSATPTLTLVQAQDKNVINNQDIGLSLSGSAIGTVPKEDLVSYRDRLTLKDNLIPQSLLIFVKKEDVEGGIYLRYDVREVTYARDDEKEIPAGSIVIEDGSFFKPTLDMVGKYISLNVLVTLRYYVVNVLREARYQYHNSSDPRKPDFQRKRTDLPRKLLLRREDMFVPDIISGDGSVLDDPSTDIKQGIEKGFEGFFGD